MGCCLASLVGLPSRCRVKAAGEVRHAVQLYTVTTKRKFAIAVLAVRWYTVVAASTEQRAINKHKTRGTR